MELWRISNYVDLTGIGSSGAAGRWHSPGRRIVYLAYRPAIAFAEMTVYMDRDLIPSTYLLLRILLPDQTSIAGVKELPQDWRAQTMLTRQIGDAWLDRSGSALLLVPSAIGQQGYNLL